MKNSVKKKSFVALSAPQAQMVSGGAGAHNNPYLVNPVQSALGVNPLHSA